ncbi:MAG: M23 family metallopeptidase [Thermoanaerobaculia bacterium]|nr:M23 family metallopeptidase [Thermoanaerobaculia bacterium]
MRTAVSFLIGLVVGATGVLLYLQETAQLAIAADSTVARSGAAAATPTRRGAATSRSEPVSTQVRSEPVSTQVRSEPASTPTRRVAMSNSELLAIPVIGVTPEDLRQDFTDNRGGGRTHGALDIRAPRGTPVVAAVDGTIRKLFTSKAGGLTIYQYDVASERCYYYAHLDRYADGIREGKVVAQGDIIGYVGTTGNAPPGTPHLHFAITILTPTKEWWKGEVLDPYPLLTGGAARVTSNR